MGSISKALGTVAGSILLAAVLPSGLARAVVLYSQTIDNPLATVSTLDSFTNCRENEGCLGKTGQVFDAAGNPLAVGNLTDTILYTFTLTQAEIDAINANPGAATLSMTAARDLGLRAGEATNTDYLVTSLDGTVIGNLFGMDFGSPIASSFATAGNSLFGGLSDSLLSGLGYGPDSSFTGGWSMGWGDGGPGGYSGGSVADYGSGPYGGGDARFDGGFGASFDGDTYR